MRFIFIFFQLLTIARSEQRIDICRSENSRCIGFTCDQLKEYKADFEDKYCKFEICCKTLFIYVLAQSKRKTNELLKFNAVTYTFRITPVSGSFEEVRLQCNDMNGELIYKNLGPEGKYYHKCVSFTLSWF